MSFIVIEGLDGAGKTTSAAGLAAQLGAVLLSSPPRLVHEWGQPEMGCVAAPPTAAMGELRHHFDKRSPTVRRAYYRAAGLVASELAVRALETGRHVVMDRYWPSTVAFARLDNPPPEGWFVPGQYPPEYRVPDVVFLLTVDEAGRLRRLDTGRMGSTEEEGRLADDSARRAKVLDAYHDFDIVEVDTSDRTPDDVVEQCMAVLRDRELV